MQTLARWIISTTLFLVPLFFLPLTRDVFDFNKFILLLGATLLLLGIWAIETIRRGRVEFVIGPLDRGVFALGGTYLLSYIISSPNKIFALTQSGAAGTVFTFILFYFLVRQFLFTEKTRAKEIILAPLLLSAVTLSILIIIQATGLTIHSSLPEYLKNRTFTPAGSLVMLGTFLFLMLIAALQKGVSVFKNGTAGQKTLTTLTVPIIFIALIASVILMTRPESRPIFLPQGAGWSIAINAFTDPRNALVGVGPSNFVNAFTAGKPASLNTSEFWRFRSGSSSNWYFQVMTETGIVGLAALGLLVYLILKFPRKSPAILVALVLALFIPANFLLLLILFSFLATLDLSKASIYAFPADRRHGEKELLDSAYEDFVEKNVTNNNLSRPVITIIGIALLVAVCAAYYFAGRAYAADITMRNGIRSAFTTNNQETYELQRKAVSLNPFDPDYRVIFAQTNMALANLISRNKDITDEQKKTVTELVTQSVNNGKLAVRLYPSAATWENLALLYSNLLNAVKGADEWTVDLYQKALQYDPANPALHVSMGGIYYSLKKNDAAGQEFGTAIRLKGDYANAWYNLANALREVKNIEAARNAYQSTLKLLKEGTPDYDKAKKELEALPAAPPPSTTAPTAADELTTPESTPSSNITDEAAPQEEEINPDVQVGTEETVNATESGTLLLPQTTSTPEQ